MNDKEIFWSLISPHLVDRPNVVGRFNYSLDDSLSYWGDLTRFVSRNHKFILPDDVTWEGDLPASPTVRDIWVLPIDKYPNKMVILGAIGLSPNKWIDQLWFDLSTVRVQVRLTPMLNSTTDYVMGDVEIYRKPVRDDPSWPYIDTLPSFGGLGPSLQYGVWPPSFLSFINWRIDPFGLK